MKDKMFKNKRGILYEEVIFFILNLVFFVILTVFIVSSSHSRPLYEQAYAKQIAFMIDEAKPDMSIYIDMEKPLERFGREDPIKVVKLDKEENRVIVNFGSSGGHYFYYFTNLTLSLERDHKYLVIKVGKNEE